MSRRIIWDASDFRVGEEVINQLASFVASTAQPLLAAKFIAQKDMKRKFKDEEDPSGLSWDPLNDKYKKRRVKEGDKEKPILQRPVLAAKKGRRMLKEEATDLRAFKVIPPNLFFDTDTFQDTAKFWMTHEYGNDTKNVPERPFIDLSAQAETEILGAFTTYYEYGISNAAKHFAVSSRGALQFRQLGSRNPGWFGRKVEF